MNLLRGKIFYGNQTDTYKSGWTCRTHEKYKKFKTFLFRKLAGETNLKNLLEDWKLLLTWMKMK
jgi:hypothetical protein